MKRKSLATLMMAGVMALAFVPAQAVERWMIHRLLTLRRRQMQSR